MGLDLTFGLAPEHYADLARVFARHPAVERVLIFGSRAKGTHKPASDFDLAVCGADLSDGEFARLWSELDGLPLAFKLDVLHWDRLGNEALRARILVEGQQFYPLRAPS